jgi:hypothetical protein
MGKTNFFLSTMPFSPWAILATWLHVGAPQKIQEKMNLKPVLTPKIPCVFLPNFAVFDIGRRINFSKQKKYENLRK